MNTQRLPRRATAIVAAAVLATLSPVQAAVWDGTAGDLVFGTPTNWDTDIVPLSAENAIFNDAGLGDAANVTVTLGGDQSVRILRFGTAANANNGTPAVPLTKNLTISGNTITVVGNTSNQNGINQTNAASGSNVIDSNVILGNSQDLSVGAGSLTINGTIGETSGGSKNVSRQGTGRLELNNANTYTGTTSFGAGTTLLGNAAALGNATSVVAIGNTANANNAEVLTKTGLTFARDVLVRSSSFATPGVITLGGAAGGGTSTWSGAISLNRSVTLTAGTGTVTFAGNITNGPVTGFNNPFVSSNVTKADGGTVVLAGTNTYTGATTITNGTLSLVTAGTNNIASSPAIVVGDAPGSTAVLDVTGVAGGFVVGAGQAIGGQGTIVGPLTIAGTLSPGNSIGTTTFNENVALAGTTSIELDSLGGLLSGDLVNGLGTVTLGGTLSVADVGDDSATTYVAGDSWNLFDGSLTGAFALVTLPELGGGLAWDASQLSAGGDGTLAVIEATPVPEPGGVALGLAGGMAMLARRRRGARA